MHLLNTSTLKLKDFVKSIPDYAILSHTWGDDEVTFNDIDQPYVNTMAGYDKIVRSCAQAVEDGFEWIWIDTCCIDKKSSAELSEAINSMYKWYWEAEICYAYLSDYQNVTNGAGSSGSGIGRSRWFYRGWTLQELLAPVVVEFYDWNWVRIGTKSGLIAHIEQATRIDRSFLLDRQMIKTACVATKFGWAARRETTRPEDIAYCLLGLMDVKMPMLYGEGSKAFYRLQLEVLQQTRDHTIFAWEPDRKGRENPYREGWGMLAPSPAMFGSDRVAEFRPWILHEGVRLLTHEMTNMGLRITMPCIRQKADDVVAILNCQHESEGYVAIPLKKNKNQRYARTYGSGLIQVGEKEAKSAKLVPMYVEAETFEVEYRDWNPCTVKLRNVRVWDIPGGLRSEVTVTTRRNEQAVSAEGCLIGDGIALEERECAAIELKLGATRVVVLIGFGYQHHFTLLALGAAEPDTTPREDLLSFEKVVKGASQWGMIRDHMLEIQDRTVSVEVSAKRTRARASPCWQLSIGVWDASKGKPDDDSWHRLQSDWWHKDSHVPAI
ncbi:Nn.00g092210.m01.CDS01 [Neocucurbitaria sp. VM-36]